MYSPTVVGCGVLALGILRARQKWGVAIELKGTKPRKRLVGAKKASKNKKRNVAKCTVDPNRCILCGDDELQRATFKQNRAFRGLVQLNSPEGIRVAGLQQRLACTSGFEHQSKRLVSAELWFPSGSLQDRLVRALAAERAIDMKELCESFEFFTRTRKYVRGTSLADMCCGHGLTGILFAVFERKIDRVFLVDLKKPQSFKIIYRAVESVAPWIKDKLQFIEADIQEYLQADCPDMLGLPLHTSIIAVHACGPVSDWCMQVAIRLEGNLAMMPCCYGSSRSHGTRSTSKSSANALPPSNALISMSAPLVGAPPVLHEVLGRGLAQDVHRTYTLHAAGYDVEWHAIPAAVTQKNRVLVARRQ
jgi:hypothetical protein